MESVESMCNAMARHKVLEPDRIRTLRTQWRDFAQTKADQVGDFQRWLIQTKVLTEWQTDLLVRGYGELLVFDDYKLTERIGQGRMAGVYKAVHKTTGQEVAVKVLPPSKAQHQQLLGRFLREARLAVKLDHDNIVRTFQHGKTKEGMHYIIMELLEGETLDEILARRKRLPWPEAVQILQQAIQGLSHLDEQSLVHRDLKPANLMLTPPRGPGEPDVTQNKTVKILDIGLSKSLFDDGVIEEHQAQITVEGALLGTLNYMAPEQARSAHNVDVRADIYSLGCVFYEMITGIAPFHDNVLARQVRRHAQEPVKPLASHLGGIPEAVENVVQKMLAKDPALRYSTPFDVLKDLKPLAPAPQPRKASEKPSRSFLTWLERNGATDGETPMPTKVPVPLPDKPKPPPPPLPPASKPVPMPAAAAPSVKPASNPAIPMIKPASNPAMPTIPVPIPKPASNPAMPAASQPLSNPAIPNATAPRTATPVPATPVPATPVTAAAVIAPVAKPVGPPLPAILWEKFNQLVKSSTRRDWICIGIGAGTIIGLRLVWAVLKALFG